MSKISTDPLHIDVARTQWLTGQEIVENFYNVISLFFVPSETILNLDEEVLNDSHPSLTDFMFRAYDSSSNVQSLMIKHLSNFSHVPLKVFNLEGQIEKIWFCSEVMLKLMSAIKVDNGGILPKGVFIEEEFLQHVYEINRTSLIGTVNSLLSSYDVHNQLLQHKLRVKVCNEVETSYFLVDPVGHLTDMHFEIERVVDFNIKKDVVHSVIETILDRLNDRSIAPIESNFTEDSFKKLDDTALILYAPSLYRVDSTDRFRKAITNYTKGLSELRVPIECSLLNCLPVILTLLDGKIGRDTEARLIDLAIDELEVFSNEMDSFLTRLQIQLSRILTLETGIIRSDEKRQLEILFLTYSGLTRKLNFV